MPAFCQQVTLLLSLGGYRFDSIVVDIHCRGQWNQTYLYKVQKYCLENTVEIQVLLQKLEHEFSSAV